MAKKVDILDPDDQELEGLDPETEGEEGEAEGDDKQPPKRQPPADDGTTARELKKLQNSFAQLQALVAGGTKTDKTTVSRVDETLSALLEGGYDKQEVAVLAATMNALRQDLENKYEQKTGADKVAALNASYRSTVEQEIDVFVEQYGKVVEYAKDRLINEARDLMVNDDKFTAPFNQGRLASRGDFKKVVSKIVGNYLKESGIKRADNNSASEQPDLRNSAKRPSSAISKDGEVDTKKLGDLEREVYMSTLNITKNKELALKALKTVQGKKSFD